MTYLGWITYKIGTIFDGGVLRSLTGRGAKLLSSAGAAPKHR